MWSLVRWRSSMIRRLINLFRRPVRRCRECGVPDRNGLCRECREYFGEKGSL